MDPTAAIDVSFEGTDLDMVLRSNGIETLVLAGIATSCVVLDRSVRRRRLSASSWSRGTYRLATTMLITGGSAANVVGPQKVAVGALVTSSPCSL
jgi:hypothetical protein